MYKRADCIRTARTHAPSQTRVNPLLHSVRASARCDDREYQTTLTRYHTAPFSTPHSWSTDLHGNEYILVEFMPFGSLDKCLANFGPSLRNRSKLLMCEQICHAMCELASEGVLHRDLAARNILVQSMQPVHVKVGKGHETATNINMPERRTARSGTG